MAPKKDVNDRAISLPGVLMILFASCFLFSYGKFEALRLSLSYSAASSLKKLSYALIVLGIILIIGSFFRLPGFRGKKRKSKKTINFPRQGMVYLLILMVMLLGALLGHANLLLLIFAMMAGVFVVNGGTIYTMLQKLQVKRTLPESVAVGQTFSVQVALTNRRRLISSRIIEVKDSFTDGNGYYHPVTYFAEVPPGQTEYGSYQMKLSRRGKYKFNTIKVSSRYPLGIVERGVVFYQRDQLLVFPRIGKLSLTWKKLMRNDQENLQLRTQKKGVHEDEFHRIREYREGDNPRAIHWTSTAKHSEIMVREYHENRDSDLDVILDLWAGNLSTQKQELRLELAISFVATILTEQFNRSNDIQLKIAVFGKKDFYWSGYPSIASLKKIMTVLAEAEGYTSKDASKHSIEKHLKHSFDDRVLMVTTRKKGSEEWNSFDAELKENWFTKGVPQMISIEADPEVIRNYFSLPEL